MKKIFLILMAFAIFSCNNESKEESSDKRDTTDIESINDNQILLESEELDENDVPKSVKETLEYQFNGYQIEQYEILANGNYKVILVKNKMKTKVVITKNGKIIKIDS